MGCTRDVINIRLANKDYINDFIKIFNEILKDDFYDKYCKLTKNHMHKEDAYGRYIMCIHQEPLFKTSENGIQLDVFVKEYLKRYPLVDFWLSYDCEELNCDGAINVDYSYNAKTKELTIVRKYANSASISFCPECEADFDEPLAYLDDYDENKTYYCPECGAEIEYEYSEEKSKINILEE